MYLSKQSKSILNLLFSGCLPLITESYILFPSHLAIIIIREIPDNLLEGFIVGKFNHFILKFSVLYLINKLLNILWLILLLHHFIKILLAEIIPGILLNGLILLIRNHIFQTIYSVIHMNMSRILSYEHIQEFILLFGYSLNFLESILTVFASFFSLNVI